MKLNPKGGEVLPKATYVSQVVGAQTVIKKDASENWILFLQPKGTTVKVRQYITEKMDWMLTQIEAAFFPKDYAAGKVLDAKAEDLMELWCLIEVDVAPGDPNYQEPPEKNVIKKFLPLPPGTKTEDI